MGRDVSCFGWPDRGEVQRHYVRAADQDNGELPLLELDTMWVGLDPDLPAVKLEVLDSLGQGWAVLLDPDQALELTLKLSGALGRLQQLTGTDDRCTAWWPRPAR